MIRRIAKYLPGKILKQITQALIESQVNYWSVVWGYASASEIRRLQIAKNKAARIVLRWIYGSSVAVMHNALGWSSINKIIETNMLISFHNIHLKQPTSIHNGIQLVRDKHSVNSRNRLSTIYVLSRQKREIGKITFQLRAIKKWNNLTEQTRNLSIYRFRQYFKTI